LAGVIGRNTLFGVLASVVQVGTRLVTVPIVIHHLGLGGYGIWNVIMATATYMRFGSVGVKTAYQKYVAEATGNGDYEMANNLLSTGSAVMLVISVIALIPAAYFSRHLAKFAGVPPEFLSSAAGAITLLALIMMMSNVGAAFEAIVAGALRGDLTRKLITVLSFAEAVTIILLLHLGFGLFAMAAVMGASELFYITGCFVQSRRVVPQVRLALRWVKTSVLYELFRFAGSYQLVNLLEVVYASIVPFAVLRAFGADSAGVYGVVSRVVTSAAMLLDAFLPQILSGGTLVYTLGAAERMQKLLTKAFKVTLGLSLLPMGFIAVFGPTLAYAWTGEVLPYRSFPGFLSPVSCALSGLGQCSVGQHSPGPPDCHHPSRRVLRAQDRLSGRPWRVGNRGIGRHDLYVVCSLAHLPRVPSTAPRSGRSSRYRRRGAHFWRRHAGILCAPPW
jgi:O-antigen/teichoic acid export membrane protein